jgi:hypothetical protein
LLAHPAVQGATDQTPEHSPFVVVELFTSEGCSSCPPADALLQKIHLKKTSDGQVIVGLSEHVTYWNSQGWKDPFSAEVFTDRQSTYASRLSPDGPYTPQMVINGQVQLVGNDAAALQKALQASATQPHIDLEIVSATLTPSGLDLQYVVKSPVASPLDVVAIITDDADRSNVLRGENSGRSLQHISVARSLVRIGTVRGGSEQTAHLRLPEGLDFRNGSGHHLVLLLQQPHQGAIIGTAIRAL